MNCDIIRNRDFVIVNSQDWNLDGSFNSKNIALTLAKHNRVLYINPSPDRIGSFRNKKLFLGKKDRLVQVGTNVWHFTPPTMLESVNWISNPRVFDFFNKINNQRLANDIRKVLARLDMKNIILFADNFFLRGCYLKEMLKPTLTIYYSRDYLLSIPYWNRHGERLEPAMIQNSDIAVGNSLYLKKYLEKYNKNSFYIGQGCDFTFFNHESEQFIPQELSVPSKPIIGYVGALTSIRLDIAILENIAKARADWSVVLVGPEDESFRKSELHSLKNVYFLGSKPITEVSRYIKFFDVCINPQLVNQLTIGNYPLKIDEYLAMGKPVVATRTEAMEMFEDYVYLADTSTQYVDLIEKALIENTEQQSKSRVNFAHSHSWENCVKAIYMAIQCVGHQVSHSIVNC